MLSILIRNADTCNINTANPHSLTVLVCLERLKWPSFVEFWVLIIHFKQNIKDNMAMADISKQGSEDDPTGDKRLFRYTHTQHSGGSWPLPQMRHGEHPASGERLGAPRRSLTLPVLSRFSTKRRTTSGPGFIERPRNSKSGQNNDAISKLVNHLSQLLRTDVSNESNLASVILTCAPTGGLPPLFLPAVRLGLPNPLPGSQVRELFQQKYCINNVF